MTKIIHIIKVSPQRSILEVLFMKDEDRRSENSKGYLVARVSKDLHARIKRHAENDRRSICNFSAILLERAMDEYEKDLAA